jgi:D-alanyl-D-alanine carboxypeptidase
MKNPTSMFLGALGSTLLALAGCAADDPQDVPTSSSGDALAASAPAARRNQLQHRLQADLDILRDDGVVGAVGKVIDGRDRIEARTGVARLGGSKPVSFDSQFRMGSNTKTFVAVVILQLVDEGKLQLTDTVDHWLPGVVSGHGNDGTQITIRNLLQHTSGLHNYTQELLQDYTAQTYYATRFRHYDPEQLVAIAVAHEPNFAPGAGWSYSNTNYILAGMIIKQVTGHDWGTEVHARILAPLQLTHTFEPGDQPGLPAPHAEGYSTLAWGDPLVDVTVANYTWGGAAGSLITTTDDLTRFWRALQQGKLLSPARMAEMHDTVPAPELAGAIPGIRDGLGIFWTPTRCGGYWNHLGDVLGFSTRNGVSEDGNRVVVMSRSTTIDTEDPAAQDAALTLINDDIQLLADVMCAGK